jgi:hypothetical protein
LSKTLFVSRKEKSESLGGFFDFACLIGLCFDELICSVNIVEFKRREANRPKSNDEAGQSASTVAHDSDAKERMKKYDRSQKLPLKVS